MIIFVNLTKESKEGSGIKVSMTDCLPWVVLWAKLWRIVLIKFNDVRRSSPLWAARFPKWAMLDCSKVRKLIQAQVSRHACISPCSPGWVWCVHSFKFLSLWHPTVASFKGISSQKQMWDKKQILFQLFNVLIFSASPWETWLVRVLKGRFL